MTVEKVIKNLEKRVRELEEDIDHLINENYHSEASEARKSINFIESIINDLKRCTSN